MKNGLVERKTPIISYYDQGLKHYKLVSVNLYLDLILCP